MEFLREGGLIRLISKYDGEKYFSKDYSLEEAYHLEEKKRELKNEGFDVDNYEKQHQKFTEEYLSKYYNLDSVHAPVIISKDSLLGQFTR